MNEINVTELSFEEAFNQLEETVRRLEEGELSLDESIALFEMGVRLARHCEHLLDQAEIKVRQLLPTPEGEQVLVDFDVDVGEEPS